MKILLKIVSVTIMASVILSLLSSFPSAESRRWYIKRNGQNTPLFPEDSEEVSRLGGYYVDKAASERDRVLYLTFDCGYENGNVKRILDTLSEEGVPAAFFLLDNIILKNTDLVKRMADEGHTVANHTKRHKNLTCSSEEEIAKDLSALEEIYREATGKEMSKFFRFPEGSYSISALESVKKLGYKTVFWSFAYEDWDNNKQMPPEKAKKKILSNTHNGAVILLHPTSKTNADILGELICEWRRMGYRFGTLDELVLRNG